MNEPHELAKQPDRTPIPDPTVRTVESLLREIATSHELTNARFETFQAKIDGMDQKFETRFTANDKALELLQAKADRVPSETDIAVSNLEAKHQEKFESIKTQFLERDVRTEQASRDSKVAVDAALQAAKEAVGAQSQSSDRAIAKTEEATSKQLDRLAELVRLETRALDGRIADTKERLDRIEGKGAGQAGTIAMIFAGIGALVGLVGIVSVVIAVAAR